MVPLQHRETPQQHKQAVPGGARGGQQRSPCANARPRHVHHLRGAGHLGEPTAAKGEGQRAHHGCVEATHLLQGAAVKYGPEALRGPAAQNADNHPTHAHRSEAGACNATTNTTPQHTPTGEGVQREGGWGGVGGSSAPRGIRSPRRTLLHQRSPICTQHSLPTRARTGRAALHLHPPARDPCRSTPPAKHFPNPLPSLMHGTPTLQCSRGPP
jgi:hypothetical protein